MSGVVRRYTSAPGAQFTSRQAQIYGGYIDSLSKESGAVTPQGLVEASRSPKAPTHDYFEWDNRVAAGRHRLQQARHLLAHISVVIRTGGKPRMVRAFFNVKEVSSSKEKKSVYVSVRRAFSEAELKAQVLKEAWEELKGWKERYATYKELGPLMRFIEVFEKKKTF